MPEMNPGTDALSSLQLCPEVKFAATPPHDGTLSRYYVLPADLCYKLPDHLTLEHGALVSSHNQNPRRS